MTGCRIGRVVFKESGTDLTILPPMKDSECFTYASGEVTIRAPRLTVERALFLLEQVRQEIWALNKEQQNG